METLNAKAVQAASLLRRDSYLSWENLDAASPDAFHRWYAGTPVTVAATENCLYATVNTAVISSTAKELKPQSVFLVTNRSLPVVCTSYSLMLSLHSDNDCTAVRDGPATGVPISPASAAPFASSLPPAIGGGSGPAAVAVDSLMTASAAALACTGAVAFASVAATVPPACYYRSEAAAIAAATDIAVVRFNTVSTVADRFASSNGSASAGAAATAAYGVFTALPCAASSRLPATKRLAHVEYPVAAFRGVEGCGLRQQQQRQRGGAETTAVRFQQQKHRLGLRCDFVSVCCSPSPWKSRRIPSVSSNQPNSAHKKDHANSSFDSCCCCHSDVSAATAAAVAQSSAPQQASGSLTQRLCPALWHILAFCCSADMREKHHGSRAGAAAVTLLTVILLTLSLHMTLCSTAASALRIDTAALATAPIAVYTNAQRCLPRAAIDPHHLGLKEPSVSVTVAARGAVAAVRIDRPAGAPAAAAVAAAACGVSRPGGCGAWRSASLCVDAFDSSAVDSFAASTAASGFPANGRQSAVLADVSPSRFQRRRNAPAAMTAAAVSPVLRRIETRPAAAAASAVDAPAVAAAPASAAACSAAAAAVLTLDVLTPRASAGAAAELADAKLRRNSDASFCRKSAAARLRGCTHRRRRSYAAAALSKRFAGASPAPSPGACAAHAEFAAAAAAAIQMPLVSPYQRAAATRSHCSSTRLLALIPSLRLQAPLLELQLPRLLLRLPLRAISIHLRYKLQSEKTRRSSSSNGNSCSSNSSSSSSIDKVVRSFIQAHSSSSSKEEDSIRNNVIQRHASVSSNSSTVSGDTELEKVSSLDVDTLSSGVKSTVDSSRRSSSVYGDENTDIHSSTAEEERQRKVLLHGLMGLQQKEKDEIAEAAAAAKRETAERQATGGDWDALTDRRKEEVKQTAGKRVTQLAKAEAAAIGDKDEVTEIKGRLQQDALLHQQRMHQQKQNDVTLGIHRQQQQQKTSKSLSHGVHRAEILNTGHSHSSIFDLSSANAAADRAAAAQPRAAATAYSAAEASKQAAVVAAPSSRIAEGEGAKTAEVTAALKTSHKRAAATQAIGGVSAGAAAMSAGIGGAAYRRTTATATAAENVMKVIAAVRNMINAWTSPSIGVDIHPASNTFCFVAEAFPLNTADAAATWFTKQLFHLLFPPSTAALLRLSLFPDGFCMISSAVISPAAIISHLLLTLSSSSEQGEKEKVRKKRLLLQGGLQHRWIDKLTQLLQVQLVAGCNLLHAMFAPRSSFFMLLLLGRPPCCPRGIRRCYTKALLQQQRRFWKQQQQQLWGKWQQQHQTWQQQQPWHQQHIWNVYMHEKGGHTESDVSPESLLWWKRWRSNSSSSSMIPSNNRSNILFRRDLSFLVLRSGAAGDEEEEENSEVVSGSETFVVTLSCVAASSSSSSSNSNTCSNSSSSSNGSSRSSRNSNTSNTSVVSRKEKVNQEDKQGKQTQSGLRCDSPLNRSSNTLQQNADDERTPPPIAAQEGSHNSSSSSTWQTASGWLHLLLPQAVLRMTERKRKSISSTRSTSIGSVNDSLLVDYRRAAAAATDTPQALQFSSHLLKKFLGENQLLCSAVARGRVQWGGSDAGAAVDLQQLLETANKTRTRSRQQQQQRMLQTPHISANQKQCILKQSEGEQQHTQQQQMERQQCNDQPKEPLVKVCPPNQQHQLTRHQEQQQMLQQQQMPEQQQISKQQQQQELVEEDEPSPWSVLLRAGDVRLDVDHLTLRFELVPTDKTAAAAPTPTL